MVKRGDFMECFAGTLLLFLICFVIIYAKRSKPRIRSIYVEHNDDDEPGIIHTKVAGVSFNNDDGTSRQAIVRSLRPGEQLFLRHVPIPGHPEAMQVITYKGQQVGHLPSGMGKNALKWFKEYTVYVYVTEITGGTQDKPTRGCNIVLQLRK